MVKKQAFLLWKEYNFNTSFNGTIIKLLNTQSVMLKKLKTR